MKSVALVILIALLTLSPLLIVSPQGAEATIPSTVTRIVNSFEGATPDDVTDWGNWDSLAHISGIPADAQSHVDVDAIEHYHAFQSAHLYANTNANPVAIAHAELWFDTNVSRGIWPWDGGSIWFKAHLVGVGSWCKIILYELHGATILRFDERWISSDVDWQEISFGPEGASVSPPAWDLTQYWDPNTDRIQLSFQAGSRGDWGVGTGELYVDYLTITSGTIDVRVRFWNLYTGFGYYGEKLRARYFESGSWVDVWRNEFQVYNYDSVLLRITDIFDRNIWTGYFEVDSNPYYVDILVPLLTVVIQKPDQWDDSLPWEWRIACLPNGPSAPEGVSLMSIGFEFEVLAGWYTFEWYQTNVYKGGNLSIFLDGNISTRSSHMLTNVTLQLKPNYERTDQGKVLNASNPADWIPILIALFEEPTVRLFTYAIGTIFAVSAFSGFIINRVLKDRRERALKSQETTVRLEAKLDKITEKLEEDE